MAQLISLVMLAAFLSIVGRFLRDDGRFLPALAFFTAFCSLVFLCSILLSQISAVPCRFAQGFAAATTRSTMTLATRGAGKPCELLYGEMMENASGR
jgi:hypothetical protein